MIADEASKVSKFTPVSPCWGNVESSGVLQDMLVKIFTEKSTIDEATAEASRGDHRDAQRLLSAKQRHPMCRWPGRARTSRAIGLSRAEQPGAPVSETGAHRGPVSVRRTLTDDGARGR